MLKHLYIKNFTLIEELDISFDRGFSVITGETGAGKSIILGALGLLLGQRADAKTVKAGAAKCTIEAHFDLNGYGLDPFFAENDIDFDADDCIVRRELTAQGKSRAFINDTPVALTAMRKLGEQLIDIHSQHQNLLLRQEDFQLNTVDIIADSRELMEQYAADFAKYKELTAALAALKEEIAQSQKDEEYLRFQLGELEKASLREGLLEELEQESSTLEHTEEIKSALYAANDSLQGETARGAVEAVRSAAQELEQIANVFPTVRELAERLSTTHIELKDIANDVAAKMEDVDFDPDRLEAINSQLDRIYSLQQKFHVASVDELIAIRNDISDKLAHLTDSDNQLEELQQQVDNQLEKCRKEAAKLTAARKKATKTIESHITDRLVALGMANVKFAVDISPTPQLTPTGADKTSFLFTANRNQPLQPIANVASGGEIARVMLALKAMISGVVKLPTIIFDEIDTGVSGKIAQKMGQIMHEMGSQGRQVISITHLPQIAAGGQNHYKVYKEDTQQGTVSRMLQLSEEERVGEIAQMLSGDSISEAAMNNARELLAQAAAPTTAGM